MAISSTARHRVLLVEDHEDTRAMYAAYLGERFDVVVAGDVEQALGHMRAERPDIVVSDVALPGVDGLGLIRSMRLESALTDVPVIFLSGFDGPEHVERLTRAGAARILRKPCLPDALAQVLLEVLTTARGER